mmetsp:Transcript_8200/g.12060  ORF Transcript_8200/g.12060 Transcript_8200/m.12060 type:complete len:143 (-) Transcript_8200:84-512(-)
MLLAGGWDLIAPAKKVKEISKVANSNMKDSSVLVTIARGLHTGFEDQITLFSLPISSVLKGADLAKVFFGFADITLFKILGLLGTLRTKTGQIDGSSILMSYFLSQMTAGQNITPKKAEQYLDDNITDRFEDKFVFTYGGEN